MRKRNYRLAYGDLDQYENPDAPPPEDEKLKKDLAALMLDHLAEYGRELQFHCDGMEEAYGRRYAGEYFGKETLDQAEDAYYKHLTTTMGFAELAKAIVETQQDLRVLRRDWEVKPAQKMQFIHPWLQEVKKLNNYGG